MNKYPTSDTLIKTQSELFTQCLVPFTAWLSNNRVLMEAMSWESLHQQPDAKFLEEWDLWGKHKQNVLSKLTELRHKAATDSPAEEQAVEEDLDAVYEDDDFYMFPFDDAIFQ